MALPEQVLVDSILVVAHPDDEVLWFSSILDDVNRIIIVFVDTDQNPERDGARRAAMASSVRGLTVRLFSSANSLRKVLARRTTSSARWRSGGMVIETTFSRKNRSSRKPPSATSWSRSFGRDSPTER